MDFNYLTLSCLLVLWQYGSSCKPLHLTPLIDQGNITAALELSQVKDLHKVISNSYSGFITTDRECRNHLFFWFFPSINNKQAPLVVWLNGGPSVSSMFGLLYENGPIRIKKLDNGEVTYERRPVSWADPFSMLYIDNPVGTGYSYSETNSFKTRQEEYSEELYIFIEQFYLMFPEYLHRELYIVGQSYAGKYVPAFAHKIHMRILEKKSLIPLTGIYLGGPYFDPLTQSAEFCEYYYAMGAISHAQLMKCKQVVSELTEVVNGEDLPENDLFSLLDKVFPIFLKSWNNNYVTGEKPDYNSVETIMRSAAMRRTVHACTREYFATNVDLQNKFTPDYLVSTKSKMADLLDNYKVLLFTGDYDTIVSNPMVEAALMTTPWSLQKQYNNSTRSIWRERNKIKGFYSKTGQFCRVVIHGAGHQTPHDQPVSTLHMMVRFIQHGCIKRCIHA